MLWLCVLAAVPACIQRPLRGVPGYEQPPLAKQTAAALARATSFSRTQVAVHGSYLWTYSEDLKIRRGEVSVNDPRLSTDEKGATATQGWVQPPGTPAVGMVYLRAFEATGDRTYLEAAHEAAQALAWTQLASGGCGRDSGRLNRRTRG